MTIVPISYKRSFALGLQNRSCVESNLKLIKNINPNSISIGTHGFEFGLPDPKGTSVQDFDFGFLYKQALHESHSNLYFRPNLI